MEWISFKDRKPNCLHKERYFLVTDGKEVYLAGTDHQRWYAYRPSDQDELVDEKKMTHWIYFENIDLTNLPNYQPERSKREDFECCVNQDILADMVEWIKGLAPGHLYHYVLFMEDLLHESKMR